MRRSAIYHISGSIMHVPSLPSSCWYVQVVWICFVCCSVKSKRCGWMRRCTLISSTPTCPWYVYTTQRICFTTICAFLTLLAVINVPPFFSYYLMYLVHFCILSTWIHQVRVLSIVHVYLYGERNSLYK